jgi:hypothetical protein
MQRVIVSVAILLGAVFSGAAAAPAPADTLGVTVPLYKTNKAGTKFSVFKSSKPFLVTVRLTDGSTGALLHEEAFSVEPRSGVTESDPAGGTLREPGRVEGRLHVLLGGGATALPPGLLEGDPWLASQVSLLNKKGVVTKTFAESPPIPLGFAGVMDGQAIDPRSLAVDGTPVIDAAGLWQGDAVGPQGDPGPIGETGDAGPVGETGEQGDTGIQGPPGDQGAIGSQGDEGLQGDVGGQGPPGDPGDDIADVLALSIERQYLINEALTVVSIGSLPTASGPTDAVFDGEHLHVIHSADESLTKLRATDGEVLATQSLLGSPQRLVFDGKRIWTANSFALGILKIQQHLASDLSSAGADINLALVQPCGGMAFDGRYVWVAAVGSSTLARIEAQTGALTEFPGFTDVSDLLFDGTTLWVAESSLGFVTPVDPETGSAGVPLTVSDDPTALSFDGTNLWITDEADDEVVRVAPDGSGAVTIAVGDQPSALQYDGDRIWVTLTGDGEILVMDLDGTELEQTEDVAVPGSLAFDGRNVWACDRSADGGIHKL